MKEVLYIIEYKDGRPHLTNSIRVPKKFTDIDTLELLFSNLQNEDEIHIGDTIILNERVYLCASDRWHRLV